MDLELELQIELLRETKRKYESVLQLGRALTAHLYSLLQTQHALGDAFADLSQKSQSSRCLGQAKEGGGTGPGPSQAVTPQPPSLPPSCSPEGEPLQGGPSPAPSSTHLWRQPKGLYRGPEVGGGGGGGTLGASQVTLLCIDKNAFCAQPNQSPSLACCTSFPYSSPVNRPPTPTVLPQAAPGWPH